MTILINIDEPNITQEQIANIINETGFLPGTAVAVKTQSVSVSTSFSKSHRCIYHYIVTNDGVRRANQLENYLFQNF